MQSTRTTLMIAKVVATLDEEELGIKTTEKYAILHVGGVICRTEV